MSKLDAIRDNCIAGIFSPKLEIMATAAATTGFQIAISLELPVKFAEWASSEWIYMEADQWKNYDNHDKYMNTKELYQYWIENIYHTPR